MPLYDLKCKVCGAIAEDVELRRDVAPPPCPDCGGERYRKVGLPARIITSTYHGRPMGQLNRPSNREYQAYCDWEAAGGEPGTYEHKKYLRARSGE